MKKPARTDQSTQSFWSCLKRKRFNKTSVEKVNKKHFNLMTPEEKKTRIKYLWGVVRKHFRLQMFLSRAMHLAENNSSN
jgi:hypothetical protein